MSNEHTIHIASQHTPLTAKLDTITAEAVKCAIAAHQAHFSREVQPQDALAMALGSLFRDADPGIICMAIGAFLGMRCPDAENCIAACENILQVAEQINGATRTHLP